MRYVGADDMAWQCGLHFFPEGLQSPTVQVGMAAALGRPQAALPSEVRQMKRLLVLEEMAMENDIRRCARKTHPTLLYSGDVLLSKMSP